MTEAKISPEFAKALVAVQGQIEGAHKERSNPAFRSRYADLGNCWDAVREALQANGVAVLQFPRKADVGHVGLYTALVYGPTGEVIGEEFQVPLKDPTNPQAMGSAITYARRYALCAVLGVSPVDDDGNKAAEAPKASKRAPDGPVPYRPAEFDGIKLSLEADFNTLRNGGDLVGMKRVFTQARNSQLPEPTKTAILNDMSTAIKAAMAKESGK